MKRSTQILFVCHANVCRSPLAHGLLHHLARGRGLGDRIFVDSAGTWACEGLPPHPSSVAVAKLHGFDLDVAGAARVLVPEDLVRFDHIIAMDRHNEADIQRLRRLSAFGPVEGKVGRVRMLRNIDGAEGDVPDVPDPIGRELDVYLSVYEILHAGCEALLNELERDLDRADTREEFSDR